MTKEEDNIASNYQVALVSAYLIVFATLLIYSMVIFWPDTITQELASTYSEVSFLIWRLSVSEEIRLLLLIASAGALGSMVHALRSFGWYVGMREIKRSWLLSYILKPFVGSAIGLVFYLVIRGGFFDPQASIQEVSPFGFVALSSITGMFSDQAILKLKEIAETVLSPPTKGKDHAEAPEE